MNDEMPTLQQALTWAHVYRRALEKIHAQAVVMGQDQPHETARRVSRMSGEALCIGPDARALTDLANRAP